MPTQAETHVENATRRPTPGTSCPTRSVSTGTVAVEINHETPPFQTWKREVLDQELPWTTVEYNFFTTL
jgi:hypothetical protein